MSSLTNPEPASIPGDPEIAEALVLLSCGEQMLIILLDSSFAVDLLMNIGVWRLVVIFGWRVFAQQFQFSITINQPLYLGA